MIELKRITINFVVFDLTAARSFMRDNDIDVTGDTEDDIVSYLSYWCDKAEDNAETSIYCSFGYYDRINSDYGEDIVYSISTRLTYERAENLKKFFKYIKDHALYVDFELDEEGWEQIYLYGDREEPAHNYDRYDSWDDDFDDMEYHYHREEEDDEEEDGEEEPTDTEPEPEEEPSSYKDELKQLLINTHFSYLKEKEENLLLKEQDLQRREKELRSREQLLDKKEEFLTEKENFLKEEEIRLQEFKKQYVRQTTNRTIFLLENI